MQGLEIILTLRPDVRRIDVQDIYDVHSRYDGRACHLSMFQAAVVVSKMATPHDLDDPMLQ